MKLSEQERKALAMMRQLDARQRDELLGRMERQVIANRFTKRVAGLRKLKIPADAKIVRAYGPPGRPKKRGQ